MRQVEEFRRAKPKFKSGLVSRRRSATPNADHPLGAQSQTQNFLGQRPVRVAGVGEAGDAGPGQGFDLGHKRHSTAMQEHHRSYAPSIAEAAESGRQPVKRASVHARVSALRHPHHDIIDLMVTKYGKEQGSSQESSTQLQANTDNSEFQVDQPSEEENTRNQAHVINLGSALAGASQMSDEEAASKI